jgi:GTP-binding protein
MHFIDKAAVVVQAGDGGNGVVSFRHEKFVDRGGPDGGDGGKGGDVVFMASRNENTLASFRYQKELHATPGGAGAKRRKHGRNGGDLLVKVPVGTMVVGEDGTILADLTEDGQRVVIAHGGKGGFGNAHFVSSRRQAPRIAEKGEKGDLINAQLELKMIADVGLVGMPNAGKSTLLSVISNARPEIADYPFTTIRPNLGVVDVDGEASLLLADIPGLIEGAAQGKGLGDEFLRHVERTAVLVHLVDAYSDDVAQTYKTIQTELKEYKVDLSTKPQVVLLTKVEGLDAAMVKKQLTKLKKVVPKGTSVGAISSQSRQGLPEMLRMVRKLVAETRIKQAEAEPEASTIPVLRLQNEELAWHITREKDFFNVTGKKIERFAARTDFDSEEGVQRLRDIMRKMGIMHELVRQGIKADDRIRIGHEGEVTY